MPVNKSDSAGQLPGVLVCVYVCETPSVNGCAMGTKERTWSATIPG